MFIMLTATHDVEDIKLAREHSVAAYLQKPLLYSEIDDLLSKQHMRSNPNVVRETTNSSSRKLSILLAEDGEVNRAVIIELLKRGGHQVTIVGDGGEAIAAWQSATFDAIFMDLQMPTMDGIDATKRIRALESQGKHIPIIAITAAAMKSDEAECLAAGMDDYISKPIDFRELNRLLERLASGNGFNRMVKSTGTDATDDANQLLDASTIDFKAPFATLECGQDQQILLVQTLQKETLQRLREIDEGIRRSDQRLLVRASHSLKSASELFAAEHVKKAAEAIETASRAGDLSNVHDNFAVLRAASQKMLAEIDLWLATQAKSMAS